MPRVKRGVTHVKRRRNILKKVKGFQFGRKNLIKAAQTAATKAGATAFKHRRKKKRDFRTLWNIQINAGARENGMKYSTFINALRKNKVELDRKVLADLAGNNPRVFAKIVEKVK